MVDEYQTLSGVCFFEATAVAMAAYAAPEYQTLSGVCFFEAEALVICFVSRGLHVPDAFGRLLL